MHGHVLDDHHRDLEEEAHFTGPPEEDPVLDLLLCPFKTYERAATDTKEDPEDHIYLEHIIHQNEHDPAILWFGLFTDLIFVAIIVKFADQFKHFWKYESQNFEGADLDAFFIRIIGETLLFFFSFFIVWLELCQVNTRFHNLPGALDDTLFFVYLCGLIVMSVQMSQTEFLLTNKVGFLCGLITSFIAIFLLHVAYLYYIPLAQRYAERRIKTYSFSIIVLVIALIVSLASDKDDDLANWWTVFSLLIACGAVLTVALISFRVDPRYTNWTGEYFSERFGILIMILTGESILALMVGDASASASYYYTTHYYQAFNETLGYYVDTSETYQVMNYEYNKLNYTIYQETGAFFQKAGSNFDDYLGVFVAFLTMYTIKNIYFGSDAKEEDHALEEEGHPGSVLWVIMHFPLAFCLLGCGVAYKLLFTTIHESSPEAYRLMLGLCLMGAILSMLVIRASHDKFVFPVASMAIRVPAAVALPLGVLLFDNTMDYMIWCLAFTILSWAFDLLIMESLELKKPPIEEEKHHGHSDGPKNVCDQLASICGFVDMGAYEGAFHGPKHEGDPRQLITDVVFCRILEEPAPAPHEFPEEFIEEIKNASSQEHGHGGHGHDDAHGHGDDGEEHDTSGESTSEFGWFGEFTDLIFVAVIIKFADQMKYKQVTTNLSDDALVETDSDVARVFLEAALYFGAFFVTWLELQHILLRFKNMPGIFDDLMHFFYLSGIIGMAIQMNRYEYLMERREAFCIWFAFCMACLVILHAKFHQIDAAQDYCKKRIVAFTASAVMALGGAFLGEYPCAILLVLSYSVTLWISLNSFRVWEESTPNVHIQEEYEERFGLIVMITSGESILALIMSDFQQKAEFYVIVIISFAIMNGIRLIYFGSRSEEPEMHALSEGNMPGSVFWAFLHLPLAFCLLGNGLGFKMLLDYADQAQVDDIGLYTLGCSLTGTVSCMYFIRTAHNKFVMPLASAFIRFPVTALFPLGAVFIDRPLAYVAWCLVVVTICLILDLYLIVYLQFEVDVDFVKQLYKKKTQHYQAVAHAKSAGEKKVHHGEIEMQGHGHHH